MKIWGKVKSGIKGIVNSATEISNRMLQKRIIKEIDYGSFNPSRYRYSNILALCDEDKEKYKKILYFSFDKAKKRIGMKVKNKQKINVYFIVYTSTIWQYDSVYKTMQKSDLFNPVIVLTVFADTNMDASYDQYLMSKKWFIDNGYNILSMCDNKSRHANVSWDKLAADIIFVTGPYTVFPKELCSWNASLNSLVCYAPYGAYIDVQNEWFYNLPIKRYAWKLFYETEINRKIASGISPLGDENVIVTGYTKMDTYYSDIPVDENAIWKISSSKQKKIIFAPHHSLERKENKFSTFDLNFRFILEYAKKNCEKTTWIYKPHPMLRRESVDVGLFKSIADYDKYVYEWDSLPNGRAVLTGDYSSIFKSSDAIILDSESFLLEYQYVNKPMCYLRRETQAFNELGNAILDSCYQVPGEDFDGIKNFIEEVVVGEDDKKREEREEMFRTILDYYGIYGKLAAEQVVDHISRELTLDKID